VTPALAAPSNLRDVEADMNIAHGSSQGIPQCAPCNVHRYSCSGPCHGSLLKVWHTPLDRITLMYCRIKGCRSSNSALAGASGLQYLISNHEQILADTVYRQFEIPLLEALDHYEMITADRLVMYEKSLHEQSARIRKTEADNHKVGRRRKRGE